MKPFICYYDNESNQVLSKNEPMTKDYQLCYAMMGFNKVLLNDETCKKIYDQCIRYIDKKYYGSSSLDFIIKVAFDRYTNQPVSLNDYAFFMNISGKDPIRMKEVYKHWIA